MTDLIPPTTSRVAQQTDEEINARIRRQTENNVAYFGKDGSQAIGERLRELDREWDVERLLEANAATIRSLPREFGEQTLVCPTGRRGRVFTPARHSRMVPSNSSLSTIRHAGPVGN